jgi:hypothetical protein
MKSEAKIYNENLWAEYRRITNELIERREMVNNDYSADDIFDYFLTLTQEYMDDLEEDDELNEPLIFDFLDETEADSNKDLYWHIFEMDAYDFWNMAGYEGVSDWYWAMYSNPGEEIITRTIETAEYIAWKRDRQIKELGL